MKMDFKVKDRHLFYHQKLSLMHQTNYCKIFLKMFLFHFYLNSVLIAVNILSTNFYQIKSHKHLSKMVLNLAL